MREIMASYNRGSARLVHGATSNNEWVLKPNVQPFFQPVPEPATLLLSGFGSSRPRPLRMRKRTKPQR